MGEREVPADDPAAFGRDEAWALARRAMARAPEAWSELFERHYRSVFAYVRYRLRGSEDAEDIASQVFEVAYAQVHRFDYRGVPVEAWLFGIARNLCRDRAKQMGRRRSTDEWVDDSGPSEPDSTEAVVLQQDLGAAMRALTDDQQDVLTLRFLLDRSVQDTARIMNRSEDAVKNLQRRALAAMQRALKDMEYPVGPQR